MTLARFLSIDEAAALLGVSARTVRRRLKDGSLRKAALGGRAVRIPARELDRLEGIATEQNANIDDAHE